jgi:hypothetical protein
MKPTWPTYFKWQSSWQAAYPPAVTGLPQEKFGSTEIEIIVARIDCLED